MSDTLMQGPYSNPANMVREATTATYWHEAAFNVSTLLAPVNLFGPTTTNNPEIQNLVLPSTLDRAIMVTHVAIVHNMQFTVTNAALNVLEQQRFEWDSVFSFTIQDKNYPGILLGMMLPYQPAPAGTSISNVAFNSGKFFPMRDPVKIPPGGQCTFTFTPASGLTTAATAATNPNLPGRGLTGNAGFRIKFILHGYLDRPAS